MACGHLFVKVNEVSICMKCGLTLGSENVKGCVIFDHKLVNRKEVKRKHGKRK